MWCGKAILFRSDKLATIIRFLLCRRGWHWVQLSTVMTGPLWSWALNQFCQQVFELSQSDVGQEYRRDCKTICSKRAQICYLWKQNVTRQCRASRCWTEFVSQCRARNIGLQQFCGGEGWTSKVFHWNRLYHTDDTGDNVTDAGELVRRPEYDHWSWCWLFHGTNNTGNDIHILIINMLWEQGHHPLLMNTSIWWTYNESMPHDHSAIWKSRTVHMLCQRMRYELYAKWATDHIVEGWRVLMQRSATAAVAWAENYPIEPWKRAVGAVGR